MLYVVAVILPTTPTSVLVRVVAVDVWLNLVVGVLSVKLIVAFLRVVAVDVCVYLAVGVESRKVIVVPDAVKLPVCVSIPFVPMFVLVMVVVPLI